MIQKEEKKEIRNRVHKRIRRKLAGTAERPRLAVFRSVAHIYAQVIDDSKGVTLVSASSVDKGAKTNGGNVAAAKAIGKPIPRALPWSRLRRLTRGRRPTAAMSPPRRPSGSWWRSAPRKRAW